MHTPTIDTSATRHRSTWRFPLARALGGLALLLGTVPAVHAATLAEGFEGTAPLRAARPLADGWGFKAETGITFSNWLITPTLSFNNGDVLSFQTRTSPGGGYADRLEVRFSAVGSKEVG